MPRPRPTAPSAERTPLLAVDGGRSSPRRRTAWGREHARRNQKRSGNASNHRNTNDSSSSLHKDDVNVDNGGGTKEDKGTEAVVDVAPTDFSIRDGLASFANHNSNHNSNHNNNHDDNDTENDEGLFEPITLTPTASRSSTPSASQGRRRPRTYHEGYSDGLPAAPDTTFWDEHAAPNQGNYQRSRSLNDGRVNHTITSTTTRALPSPSSSDPYHNSQQKEDRRGILLRLGQWIRQKIHLPSMGYRTIETNSATTTSSLDCQCHWGTTPAATTWINHGDPAGLAMALLVWVLLTYGAVTMVVLARRGHVPPGVAAGHITLLALAWACHAKTMLTDPGTVPGTAVPLVTHGVKYHTMCSVCQTYKPAYTHHCRVCNRCISRMDHHCPWMNNCVGAANLKHFCLFLLYAWGSSASALLIFAWNYFFCRNEQCEFHGMEIQLVRVMSCLCLGALLFTTSMLMNVTYGIMTGTGTIDRLKQKADSTWHLSDEPATPLTHIWGTGSLWGWPFPIDPVWDDFGKLMGYAQVETTSTVVDGVGPGLA